MNYNKIIELCKSRDIPIPSLAKEIGISEPGLYQMIRNRSMKVDVLEKIAKALSATLYEFFDDPYLFINEIPALDPHLFKIFVEPLVEDNHRLASENETLNKDFEKISMLNSELNTKITNMNMAIVLLTTQGKMLSKGSISIEAYEILLDSMIGFITNNYTDTNNDTKKALIELGKLSNTRNAKIGK